MLPSVAELKRTVFDQNTIAERVRELGQEITAAYPDGELLVLGLLKGSFIFLSDLVRNIDRPIQIDFLVASSYGDGTVSSGNVRLVYDPETKLEGKHILLVEDIIDTGKTLNKLVALLKQRRPESLEICALLDKHVAEHLELDAKFVGFDAPTLFLVGYGLDHAENFRHLPYIASLT
ncbi:MAG TPA: hypoxanthine phosphoribosyltransferase [Gemmatimonadales bacterium]|jgi:hypoxanthine phosphoribosyltransferase|nr:hypoxanthine phosphoribosyltransferase [Gemmatimonadales bacterium]